MKPLNPIMAVLALASVGVFPPRALAADGSKPAGVVVASKDTSTTKILLRALAADGSKPAGVVVASEDTSSIGELAKILKDNAAARADAGQRISEFLLEDFVLKSSSTKRSFIGADVDAKARGVLGAVANEWGAKLGSPEDVAVLYFVIGPGAAAPSWAPKTFKPGMKWLGKLRFLLSDPTGADWTGKSQIHPTEDKKQVTAFLNFAVAKSWSALDPRTKDEVDASVERNNNTAPEPPDTTRGAGSRLDAASQQYTLKDLYEDGAVVAEVSGPKDEHSRRISMKIYTKRMPDGTTVNEIGIFDITDSNDIFGQRFPVGGGDQSFVLDDRTPGHKKYELKFETLPGGDRKIVFARPGGGAPLETKVSELYLKRADQAANIKNIVNVGGEEFYALPQGGAKGALALFPKSLIDGRGVPGDDARNLVPSLYAEVGVRGSDGRNENIRGKPHLGAVGEKEFHLEFNKALGVWEVKEGEGDKPKPEAKPATGSGATTGGGTTGDGDGTPTSDGELSIEDVEKRIFEKSDGCKKNPDDVKDLAADLKGKYGIISCTNAIDGLQQVVLVPKSVSDGQQLTYGSIEGYKIKRARFLDHYLVIQFDKQVLYMDLLKPDKSGFELVSSVNLVEKAARDFQSMIIFLDALKNYLGVSGEALTEIPKRVAQALGSKPHKLTGAYANGKLIVNAVSGGAVYLIWPKLEMPGGAAAPAANPYASLSGPANAFDAEVASADRKFDDELPISNSQKLKLAVPAKSDIALYETVDLLEKKEPKRYFAMFKYLALDPAPNGTETKTFRQKPFEVFNTTSPYPGTGLQMQGLTADNKVVVRGTLAYRFVAGSKKEKGVLAVYQEAQVTGDNQKDKKYNCVGPIMWWGLADRDAALKVCNDEKL